MFRIAGGSLLRCAELRFSNVTILSPEIIGTITAVSANLINAHSAVCTWLGDTFINIIHAVVAIPARRATAAVAADEVSASATVQARITGAFVKVDLALLADVARRARARV